jgi:hypothetical protein
MEKMQKEICDAVLIFPPIRLSVLLICFREKSRGCIESSQIFEFSIFAFFQLDGRQHGGMAYILWNYDNLSTKWCIKHLPNSTAEKSDFFH